MDKSKNPDYILNPKTGRYVLKSGPTGKKISLQDTKTKTPCKKNNKIIPVQPRPKVIPPKSILILNKLGLWQVFQLEHCVDGIKKVRSVLTGVHQDKELIINKICLTYLVSLLILLKKEKFVMIESARNTKWMTLLDSFNSSDFTILTMNLSLMLVQVLTGINQDLYPYWNLSYKELSQKLWLPKLIDWQDSQPIYSDSSLNYVDVKSWFTIKVTEPSLDLKNNWSKMSSTSCMSTLAGLMGEEKEKFQLNQQHTRKIRIYPNKTTSKLLKTWIAGTNCIYNKIVYFQSHCNVQDKNMSEYTLREKFVNEKIVVRANRMVVNQGIFMGHSLHGGHVIIEGRTGNRVFKGPIISSKKNPDLNHWVSKLPKVVRSGAVKDYCWGRLAALENLKQCNIQKFRMNYRKHSDRIYPSLHLEKNVESLSHGKYIRMFPSVFKKSNVSNSNMLVNKKDRHFIDEYIGKKNFQDCKLKYDMGRWYLLVPYMKDIHKINLEDEKRGACGIDPGTRKPMSIYDAEKLISISYKKDIHDRLQRKLQVLQSLKDLKQISPRSYKQARTRLRRKWVCLRDDMHYKCASYLVSNYKYIGLPPFKTGEMVSNENYLHKKVKIEMLNWGHYKFKMRLKSKSRNLSHVLNIDESYTTQGCTNCGTLKHMGGLEIYKCSKCGHKIGRDDGSSRSIFMCMMHMRYAKN